ncbi:hypothetical protein BDV29DRAFT_178723 [Aspergillus leporis]|uniref:Uncharacterized protein n=1 Tax=Aspergillus leporis TaxID=41062 RepID=A0A5N5WT03_9EURO|nr:hypothetical protein BDV29DRAFT_178723 [Aspergillus leporis]
MQKQCVQLPRNLHQLSTPRKDHKESLYAYHLLYTSPLARTREVLAVSPRFSL